MKLYFKLSLFLLLICISLFMIIKHSISASATPSMSYKNTNESSFRSSQYHDTSDPKYTQHTLDYPSESTEESNTYTSSLLCSAFPYYKDGNKRSQLIIGNSGYPIDKTIRKVAIDPDDDSTFKFDVKVISNSKFKVNTCYSVNKSIKKLEEVCDYTLKRSLHEWVAKNKPNLLLENIGYHSLILRAKIGESDYERQILELEQKHKQPGLIDTIVSFGDSLSDNDMFYNHVFKKIPNRNTWYYGHFTNGWTWIEYAVDNLSTDEFKITHINQAWASAGVKDHTIANIKKINIINVRGLSNQVQAYNLQTIKPDPKNTLYTILIGANDFFNYNETVENVASGVYNAVISLIDNSKAKNITISTLPDIAILPAAKTLPKIKVDVLHNKTIEYNKMLNQIVNKINKEFSSHGVNITLFNAYDICNDIVKHGKNYSFDNVDQSCVLDSKLNYIFKVKLNSSCDGENYVFWDSIHPSTRTHRILGEKFTEFVKERYKF